MDTSIVINLRWTDETTGLGGWSRIDQFPGDREMFEECLPVVGDLPQLKAGDRVEVVLVETRTDDRIYAREMVVPAGTPGQLVELRKRYAEGL